MTVNTTGDMPLMCSSTYGLTGTYGDTGNQGLAGMYGADPMEQWEALKTLQRQGVDLEREQRRLLESGKITVKGNKIIEKGQSMKRIVRVYLVDPDDKVPVEKSVLHQTGEITTDLTDQELYFELPVTDLLKSHNALRATIVDRKASEKFGKEVYLDPVKIRDLKMQVVVIASF